MKKQILFLVAITMLLSACSTDLDVKGDWKETMVVYGLLDQSQNKQYIKINKAFLGEGNAFSFAQVKDSVQFANALSVQLKDIPSTGAETIYSLLPDNSISKDAGIFYGPDQANAIYSFTTPANLNTSHTYKLIVRNSETGIEATATTKLIKDFGNFTFPVPTSTSYNIVIANSNAYKFKITWQSGANAKLYQLIMRFNYIDSTLTGNINQHIDKVFPEIKTQTLAGGENIEFSIVGQDYLQFIADKISDYPGLIHRKAVNIDLISIAAGEELSTFMDVNKPSTGVVQEKPEFTNITNGLGIFSARYYKAPFTKVLSKTTLDTLSGGFRTCKLKFLNGLGTWPGCQ